MTIYKHAIAFILKFYGVIDMREKTCCFAGHRKLPPKKIQNIMLNLNREVDRLIESGITAFISGGALGFDYDKLKIMRRSEGQSYNLRHCPSVFFT